jgi:hypothetical protein
MNAAVIAFGAISVATATVFINGPQPDRSGMAIFDSQPAGDTKNETNLLDDRKADANFNDESLGNVLKFTAAAAAVDLVIHERDFAAFGISVEDLINLQLKNKSLSQILKHVSEQLEHPMAWRVNDGVLEVATNETFDRREVVLASFDVQRVLDLIWHETNDTDKSIGRLERLMIEYVEPDAWYVNGGDLATLQIVGGKMFVKAPSRFHEPIQWILGQLEENAAEHTAGAPGPAGLIRAYSGAGYYRSLPPGSSGGPAAPGLDSTGFAPSGGLGVPGSTSGAAAPSSSFGGESRSILDTRRPSTGGATSPEIPSGGAKSTVPIAETPAEPVDPTIEGGGSNPEPESRDR